MAAGKIERDLDVEPKRQRDDEEQQSIEHDRHEGELDGHAPAGVAR
jgi:hypothetical protein